MDVNSIKASIEAAGSVSDIIQILQTANENGVVLSRSQTLLRNANDQTPLGVLV